MKKLKKRLERRKEVNAILAVLDMIDNPTDVVTIYKPESSINLRLMTGNCDCECCRGRRREDNYGGLF
tara:strand:+ start:42 stop:245 length:204 start_codon:yes stop_codon:yes gene_type:complete